MTTVMIDVMGRKVVDYQLVSIWDVVTELAEGWELYGYPVIVPYQTEMGTEYYPEQAMVKYEEDSMKPPKDWKPKFPYDNS